MIQGQYSLTGAAKKIGVTSAWINRVQRETKIGGELGKKGHKVAFSTDNVETFRRAKVLRILGFTFKDIKTIYDVECEILTLLKYISKEYELSNIASNKMPLILTPYEIITMGPTFEKKPSDKAHQLLYKEKNIAIYIEKIKQVPAIAKEVLSKKHGFMSTVDDVNMLLGIIESNYPDKMHS